MPSNKWVYVVLEEVLDEQPIVLRVTQSKKVVDKLLKGRQYPQLERWYQRKKIT